MQHLRPNAIDNSEGHFSSVLRRIDVQAKRTLAKRRIHDLDDGFRNRTSVGILGHDGGEGLLDFPGVTLYGPASYSARRALSAGTPAWAKWFVPLVKAPGTMIEVSMPHSASSRA